jgi:homoserine dehydrogenase
VFGYPLKPAAVLRQGITNITREQVQRAIEQDKRIKLIASLRMLPGNDGEMPSLEACVQPVALPLSDPLARVDGVMNALTISTDTLSEVTITGPGAGRIATGQGLLADIIACARE